MQTTRCIGNRKNFLFSCRSANCIFKKSCTTWYIVRLGWCCQMGLFTLLVLKMATAGCYAMPMIMVANNGIKGERR